MLRPQIHVLGLLILSLFVLCFSAVADDSNLEDFLSTLPQKIQHCKEKKRQLDQEKFDLENKMRAQIKEVRQIIPPDYQAKVEILTTQMTQRIHDMDSLAAQVTIHLNNIESATTPQEKADELRMAETATKELGWQIDPASRPGLEFQPSPTKEFLERMEVINASPQPLERRVADMKKEYDDKFGGKDMGGGVFINQTAKMPLKRSDISRAEYDLGSGRFIFYAKDREIYLPPMDAGMTATVIKCMYYGKNNERDISESFNINPVTNERNGRVYFAPPGWGYLTLFGCQNLLDTKVGQILIDSDHLIVFLMWGETALGINIVKETGFPSLYLSMMDHPVVTDTFQNSDVPVSSHLRKYDIRAWIQPNDVTLNLNGDNLEFNNISFRMFTDTVKLNSQRKFSGQKIYNPGAEVWRSYFNNNFARYSGLTVRKDEYTGSPIKPFQELKEVAKIVSVVRWIKGIDSGKAWTPSIDSGKKAIPMDTSWVNTFPISEGWTPPTLPALSVSKEFLEKLRDTTTTTYVYDQYGISRIYEQTGSEKRYEHYSDGRIKKITDYKNGQGTVLLDVR